MRTRKGKGREFWQLNMIDCSFVTSEIAQANNELLVTSKHKQTTFFFI